MTFDPQLNLPAFSPSIWNYAHVDSSILSPKLADHQGAVWLVRMPAGRNKTPVTDADWLISKGQTTRWSSFCLRFLLLTVRWGDLKHQKTIARVKRSLSTLSLPQFEFQVRYFMRYFKLQKDTNIVFQLKPSFHFEQGDGLRSDIQQPPPLPGLKHFSAPLSAVLKRETPSWTNTFTIIRSLVLRTSSSLLASDACQV